jgi:hypothetical protein
MAATTIAGTTVPREAGQAREQRVFALLTCIVMMFAGMRNGFAVLENEAAAKIGVMLAAEDIPIGDTAPSINAKAALWVLGAHHFIAVERQLGGTIAFDVLTRSQNSPAWVVSSSKGEIKRHFDRMFQQARSGNDTQFVGWRLPSVFYGNFGRDVYFMFGTMNVDVGSSCDDIGSQLPLPCASHHINCSYQRKELEKRDHAGDHSDFVAQAPTVKPRSEHATAHPSSISRFLPRNMGLRRALARPGGAREAQRCSGCGQVSQDFSGAVVYERRVGIEAGGNVMAGDDL